VGAFALDSRCPRIALAHRQRRRELAMECAERAHVRRLLQSYERLVAHRELQLVRAQASSSQAYMRARERKLKFARARLKHFQARAETIGALGNERVAS
jgi:hypothetical protein